jgi:hypothetical protein
MQNFKGVRMFKLLFLFIFSTHLLAQSNLQLINWFAGADIVATGDNLAKSDEDDRNVLNDGMLVREFEFSAVSQIDQTWQGILTLAYHHELQMEEEHIEVHEAMLFSSKLLPMANVKIGKFFLGVGRLNRFHRHDWIFTEAPLVQKSFFGNEGVKDTGFEYSRLLGTDYNLKATIGLVAGNEFKHEHSHDEDEHDHGGSGSPYEPTRYIRLSSFTEFSTLSGVETGLNYLERRDNEGTRFQYSGLDLIYKKRVNQFVDHLLQFEFWHRKTDELEEHSFEDMGAYAYYEKGLNRHHALGFRAEYYLPADIDHGAEHEHEGIDGIAPTQNYHALSLSYNYYNSEFMRTRLTLEHHNGVEVDEDEVSFQRLHLQFVFNIGAHPAHIY